MSVFPESSLLYWRSGDWLDRERAFGYARLLLAVEIIGFLFLIAGTHGWIVPLARPTTTDFVSFYAAGALADSGTPQLAYDHAAHLAAEESATASGIEYQFFNYPPVFLLLCALVARLPYLVAFILFEAATLVLYLIVARRILGEPGWATLVPLLAFPPVFWNLGLGQNALLTAALFGAATLLIDRRPIVAGLLFGAICYKPHFGLLVPVALAAGGRWRAFAAAALSVTALVALSVLLFGRASGQAFFATAVASPTIYESGRILFTGFVSPFGGALQLGANPHLAYLVQGAASVTAAIFVGFVWRRGFGLPLRAAALCAATLVAIPVVLLYDMMLATIAICWLFRGRDTNPITVAETALLALFFVALLDARHLAEATHIPVAPLAALSVMAMVAARVVRHQPAAQRMAARVAAEEAAGSFGTGNASGRCRQVKIDDIA
jgi:alpha-1,2-mannosyltransferase